MNAFKDQLGREVLLQAPPKRIVSLVPSQTELLYDLGLNREVAGITKFCIHPEEWFRSKTRVGGTKQVDIEKIKALNPDLVIANKEENLREQIEGLAALFPVWVSDVNNLQNALEMISCIGAITGTNDKAQSLVSQIEKNFTRIKVDDMAEQEAGYLIWKDPYMTVGHDTFINDMLLHAGLSNFFKSKQRYPVVDKADLKNCPLLLLSSEPFPFSEKHRQSLQPMLPHTRIILVDGEMFSWYGSRLLKAPAYFMKLRRQIAAIS